MTDRTKGLLAVLLILIGVMYVSWGIDMFQEPARRRRRERERLANEANKPPPPPPEPVPVRVVSAPAARKPPTRKADQ